MSSTPPTDDWRARIADLAVAGRTAALRLLSPLERLAGAFRSGAGSGAATLPPLWLRRHAGPVQAFRTSAEQAMALLDRLGWLRPDLRVLDFGCGPGSLVARFAAVLGPEGRFRGLDIHTPSIEWCRRAFAHDTRFSFERLDPAASGEWPATAGSWDLVLAKSVFTHLLEPEAKRALAEIRRVLAPGGRAMITAFLFDHSRFEGEELPWFPCPGPASAVRWRRASRPTAAVAVDAATFRQWIADSGLRVEAMIAGFHPGGPEPPTGQDTLLLGRAEGQR